MIKAVIFDLDGTLLNTLTDISLAMNRVLARKGLPQHTEKDYRYFVGQGIRHLIEQSLPQSDRHNEALITECRQELRLEYQAHQEEHTLPYSGINEMLTALQERHIRLAILSNKPHENTVNIVASLLAGHDFEIVLGARKDVPVKPEPHGIFEIIETMKLQAEDFLYVGDTDTDMQTARAGGITAVGVEWGFRDREELLREGARYIITHPSELLHIIDIH